MPTGPLERRRRRGAPERGRRARGRRRGGRQAEEAPSAVLVYCVWLIMAMSVCYHLYML